MLFHRSWTVSVRDVRSLEKRLREGHEIELPKECEYNSKVIQALLKEFGPRVVPEINSLSDTELKQLSDTVAYLMRTDTIITGNLIIGGPNPLIYEHIKKISGEDGKLIHLINDPSVLHPDWELPKELRDSKSEYRSRGAEFFRCYSAAFDFLPKIKEKLDTKKQGIFSLAFPFADITAYLLNPNDLTDYIYTEEEINRFHKRLVREIQEI